MQTWTALARTAITLSFLFYASWSDYKTREVSNSLWILFAPPVFTLTFMELYLHEPSQLLFYGICFCLTSAFAIILFYSGGFGGADAKALMCLALALPFYPNNLLTPISSEISPIAQKFFPLTVFSNSILMAAATAIYMLLYNAFWHKKTNKKLFRGEHEKESFWRKLLVLMTGYKVSVSKLKEKWHLYPLEDLENAEDGFKRKLILLPKDEERNAIVERLANAVETGKIQDMIWATPGLPMLIFITAGLIIALFFGDIVWIFVRFLLG